MNKVQKLKCTISYDGTNFSGYQVQPNKRTVQTEIEKVLTQMHKGKSVRIYASGRTDAGVHARGQVIHFTTELNILPENWQKAMNALLPDDIYVQEVEQVDDAFHARFSATEKEYRYHILLTRNREERDVFLRNYRYMTNERFDDRLLEAACREFEGRHDFTAFSSARATVKGDKIRTLYEVSFERVDDELIFTLRGNGFLYHMVRIIVSVLLEAGRGEVRPEQIREMFIKKDRGSSGKTLPAQGLYLINVSYEEKK
ncbi:MAG TPA: tRNA pseudouridine(38-40) synthase TruA [Pseudogracilibacillus sp.]|nr:tRNA pseudouridine(38-40) synthase TruA [Pseudogracilibacillus sp.]